MIRKTYMTNNGGITYWLGEDFIQDRMTLVFLPGLTADHTLFDKQIEFFKDKYNVFVWDAPAHALSRPFDYGFSLADKAGWLNELFLIEKIEKPVIVGQSMGGYLGQAYCQYFPGRLKGFAVIDSAPLSKKYYDDWVIKSLRKTEAIFNMYPWNTLKRLASKGLATTEYGRKIMFDIMSVYDDTPKDYTKLAGHGFNILADAIAKDLPYAIDCPALLICGDKDKAGFTRGYNKKWHKETGLPLKWIHNAGHNSNTDCPDEINNIILDFVKTLE